MEHLLKLPGIGPTYGTLILLRGTGSVDAMTGVEPRLPTYLAHFYGLGGEATPAQIEDIMDGWRPFRTWSSVLTRVSGDSLGLPLPARPDASQQAAQVASLPVRAKEQLTPSIPAILGTWFIDPVALVVALVLAVLYGWGVIALRRRGEQWSGWLVAAFYLLGIGSFLAVNLGFLGVYSHDLRWAFSTRTALLLFVSPALLALGRPVTLARRTLGPRGVGAHRPGSWHSRVIKFLGNAVVEPFVTVLIFAVFLTPVAGALRLSPFGAGRRDHPDSGHRPAAGACHSSSTRSAAPHSS